MKCTRWISMLLVTVTLLAPAALWAAPTSALAQAKTGGDRRPADFILPAVILVAVVVLRLAMASGSRSGRGSAGSYGLAGGAVCRHCGRAFARSVWGPNLVAGKLSRCPHCGKWSVAARASAEALAGTEARAAEAGAVTGAGKEAEAPADAADVLRRRIEESKYEPPER